MRYNFVWAVAVSVSIASTLAEGEKPGRKPNVIFILADDLGYAELGCYGQKKIRTPNLDKLAADGMRFTQYYAGNAVCAPSRCVLRVPRFRPLGPAMFVCPSVPLRDPKKAQRR